MFVALRDLRFASGRFVLIGSVVALITVLVGFLSGLTGGLAIQNISGVLALPADRIVFSAPDRRRRLGAASPTPTITEQQATAWASTDGVDSAQPARHQPDPRRGRRHPHRDRPLRRRARLRRHRRPRPTAGSASPTRPPTTLGVTTGDDVTIAGTDVHRRDHRGRRWYSHTPVVQMTLARLAGVLGRHRQPRCLRHRARRRPATPTGHAADATQRHHVREPSSGRSPRSSAFRSEIGSLLLMVAMLFGISGLVIGAFFTVWTMQRKGDIAVLKALGASTPSLVRDALGQALIVLLARHRRRPGRRRRARRARRHRAAVPAQPLTTLLPGAIMIVLGLAGAAFALRSVTSADPLTALGSNR